MLTTPEKVENHSSCMNTINEAVRQAARLVAPSWPLQNIVAVNPFWYLKEDSCRKVFAGIRDLLGSAPYVTYENFLSFFHSGRIDQKSLEECLYKEFSTGKNENISVNEFIEKTKNEKRPQRRASTFTEFLKESNWNQFVINDFSKSASGYFDIDQALVHIGSENGFWSWWCHVQTIDRSLSLAGLTHLKDKTNVIYAGKNTKEAICYMLQEMGVVSDVVSEVYLKRLVMSVLGWASRFRVLEWKHPDPSEITWHTTLEDCLCVRLAYDYLVFCEFGKTSKEVTGWRNALGSLAENASDSRQDLVCYEVWQSAFELSYQRQLVEKIVWEAPASRKSDIQMVFCIDVRSEVIRRHIEALDESVETKGFAGFFGLPVSYKRCNQSKAEHMFPVLLAPGCMVHEKEKSEARGFSRRLREHQLILSFLRSLRKGALSSFVYVELFGCIAIERFIRKTYQFFRKGLRKKETPRKFKCERTEPAMLHESCSDKEAASYAEHCARILRHMGMHEMFSPLIVLTGHGSITTNNAFATSLDCGACGGHAGDINARFLASLLNDQKIREELASGHEIRVPDNTFFIGAVHETVTDEIYILDREKVPPTHVHMLEDLESVLSRAGARSREERYRRNSLHIDPEHKRRSKNWSETRPEWGLVGNASFIIAPRSRTRGADLSGRTFLHDYNWKTDKDFKTLELIMTAPMVVTNWINMQYYASTVLPDVFGAGNKVLHSIVNESRVVEGNGGDIRIGLPIQSVFDGEKFVHEALRLSVFVEAPVRAIEEIVQRHAVVRNLVDNEWLYLFQIDEAEMKISKRIAGEARYEAFCSSAEQ
jgi:uncharacterized protein